MSELQDYVAAHLSWAKSVISANPDCDVDGYMEQLASHLLTADSDLQLFQAVAILATLREEGWLEREPSGLRDRIAG